MSTRRNKVAVRPVPVAPGLRFVRALFEFTPSVPQELKLDVGDVVKVQKSVDEFWLQGLKLHNGESGQFPRDFVKDVIIPKHTSNETLLYALDTFYPEANGDLPFDKGDIIVLEGKIDNQWGTGRCGSSVRGMFPLNYTERLLPLTIDSLATQRHDNQRKKENIKELGIAKATMSLTAQLEEELSFSAGDEITILEVSDDGAWYKGKLGNETGTLPASFVQLISPLNISKSSIASSPEPVRQSRTGSKAWKEEELDDVPLQNDVTNDKNFDSLNGFDQKQVKKLQVTDDALLLSAKITEETTTETNTSGATHSTTTTSDSTAVIERSSAENILYTVEAMHKFTGNSEQELSFDEGVAIPIFEEADDHWLVGKVGSRQGYIPRAYVSRKRSNKEKNRNFREDEEKCSRQDDNPDQNQRKDESYVKKVGSTLLSKQHVYSAPKTHSSKNATNHKESKSDDTKKAVAIYDYEARNKFDLTVFAGDTVSVLREIDDNWMEIKNESGKIGIIPTSYVKLESHSQQGTKTDPKMQSKNVSNDTGEFSEIPKGHSISHSASYPMMPILHEDSATLDRFVDRNQNIASKTPPAFLSPKPYISPKPKTLAFSIGNRNRIIHKSISVDSANQGKSDDKSGVNRSNSNPQSRYAAMNSQDTRENLRAWRRTRKISSPTGPQTPPSEVTSQVESESNTESDNSTSIQPYFKRSNRSASMRERRSRRRYDNDSTSKDTNSIKIRSKSDLSTEKILTAKSLADEKARRSQKRSEPSQDERRETSSKITWHAETSSNASTGSSSSYGEVRPTRSAPCDASESETSSTTSRKSTSSSGRIRRSAPPIPFQNRSHAATAAESTPNSLGPPSPWSPPVPQRKQSLHHNIAHLSPEIQYPAQAHTLTPSRPAPELPPPRPTPSLPKPIPEVDGRQTQRKKVPPMRPANPPHARYHDQNSRSINGGTQERVRKVTSRDMKEKIEKLRSDIEDYSRMKADLTNLYQGTLDGKERREISENMEFVKANLRRLQKEFHELIEGQQDHTYESIEQYMIQKPLENSTRTFERLAAPPLPPTPESPGSIRKKRQERRLRVASELVDTERDFLNHVTITIEDIMNELIDRQIPQVTITTLFSNIIQVKDFSERFLREMEEALVNESCPQPDYDERTFGKVFIDNNPEMKEVYMPYCRNHDDAMLLLEKLQDDADFMQAVHTCLEAIKNKVNVFDLGSFLIKPVQRFLKYPLLIEELIKLTDKSTAGNPTDHDTLILAHKMMQDVAKDINEDKRVKDLVRKYKDVGNEGISEKLGKISIKASKKKFTRLSTKFSRAAGISTQETKDPKFDEVEKKFKIMERAAKLFMSNITSYCDKCRDVLCAELVVAHAMVDMVVQPEPSHPVAVYQSMAEKMSGPLYRQFHDQVQLQVLSPVTSLINNFKSPQAIIDKRLDKLIDYERLQKHSDSKEKVVAAKHDYEALNKSLLDELPKLCDLGAKLLTSCTAIFARIHSDFEKKLLMELKPLLSLIQQSGSQASEPRIPSSMETYERFRPAYQDAIQTISRLQVVPASFGALFGTAAKASTETQRKPRASQTSRPPEVKTTLKQPSEDRDVLKKKYRVEQLYVAEKNYSASQLMDVSCCEGDLVAVLKQQDPMGITQRWFVNRGGPGNSTGFLPSAILRPYDPVRDDAMIEFPPSTSPYSSSPQSQATTPIPAPRNRSPTPSTRSSSSTGSGSTSGSGKPQLSPFQLRETLKSGTISNKEDGDQPAYDDIMQACAEEDEIFDDDFVYGSVVSTSATSPKSNKQHFRAEYDFNARSGLELTVRTGSIVKLIVSHDTDGNSEWWLVSNSEGKQGYVPSNYLTKAEYL